MMKYTSEKMIQRQALLDGISQNLSYAELAAQLGVRRMELISDIKDMRNCRDPDLLKAQRIGQEKEFEENQNTSKIREERFFQMTGMTIHEKNFQNMVHFFKPELMLILKSEDPEAAIMGLPKYIRRILTKYDIISKRGKPEISQLARDQL